MTTAVELHTLHYVVITATVGLCPAVAGVVIAAAVYSEHLNIELVSYL